MVERCPACGQAVPEYGGIVADSDRAEIRFRGKVIRNLTSTEFELFELFLEKAGRIATKEVILSFLYQLEDKEPEAKIVDVFVCKMRKKIKPLGLEIVTVWGRGYYLADPDAQVAA